MIMSNIQIRTFLLLSNYANLMKENLIRPQVLRETWRALQLPVFNCGVIDAEF